MCTDDSIEEIFRKRNVHKMQVINYKKSVEYENKVIPDSLRASLPISLIDKITEFAIGNVEEIRLRCMRYSSVVCSGKNIMLRMVLRQSEINEILKGMCNGSLYAYSDTINQGYISLPDGVRVGVCGRATCESERIIGVYDISSLCIRIPHKAPHVGGKICSLFEQMGGCHEILIYSPPGVGKTTVLRGVTSILSGKENPLRTVVIDTRGELSFANDDVSLCIDILSGYPKRQGIEIATRTLNPQVIICDEIGDYEEAMALVGSHNCGVPLIASAHAGTLEELLSRSAIRLLHEAKIFGAYVKISRSYKMDFNYEVTLREETKTSDSIF